MAQDSADFMSHLEDHDTALDKLKCDSKNIEWSTFKVKLGIDFRDTEKEWLEQELRKLLPLATHIISKNYHKEVQKTHNFLTKYCYVQWGPQIYRIYAKADETGNDKHRPVTIVKKNGNPSACRPAGHISAGPGKYSAGRPPAARPPSHFRYLVFQYTGRLAVITIMTSRCRIY